MEELVEQFLRSPKLEIYLEQINAARMNEKNARQRFLEKITEDDKAEFINGEVIFHSPVKFEHGNCALRLFQLANTYVKVHRLGVVGYEKLMISLSRNDYEPDLCFWHSERSKEFQADQMRFPAPDWVVEVVSPSTEANDRGVKFDDYAAHGISEYWIVDSDRRTIEQYQLGTNGKYQIQLKSSSGMIRSTAINGFEIPIVAVFDDAENLRVLKSYLG